MRAKAYLHVVRESFERLRLGTSDIFGPGSEGVVRLRADPGFIDYWLAPRLKLFLDAYPDISLQVSVMLHGIETPWNAVDMEVRLRQRLDGRRGRHHPDGGRDVPGPATRVWAAA